MAWKFTWQFGIVEILKVLTYSRLVSFVHYEVERQITSTLYWEVNKVVSLHWQQSTFPATHRVTYSIDWTFGSKWRRMFIGRIADAKCYNSRLHRQASQLRLKPNVIPEFPVFSKTAEKESWSICCRSKNIDWLFSAIISCSTLNSDLQNIENGVWQ